MALVKCLAQIFVKSVITLHFQPFKKILINILELIFMSIFSAVTLYLYPSIDDYKAVNAAVEPLEL